jgi:hypothetical protein
MAAADVDNRHAPLSLVVYGGYRLDCPQCGQLVYEYAHADDGHVWARHVYQITTAWGNIVTRERVCEIQ